MSEFNITVEGGSSVRLLTAGKYCDRDIFVTATGGGTTPANPIIEPLSVTENGTYTAPNGVDGYSPVEVNVPIPDGYIVPSGTKTITENGTHDAREYESVAVNVPIPEGYIQPSGTLDVTENGTHDVKNYASVNVNVASGGGGGSVEACTITVRYSSTNELSDDILTFIYQDTALNSIKITRNSEWEFTEEGSPWMPEYVATITLENVAKNSFIYFYAGRTCHSQLATPLINTDNGINQYTVDVLWQVIGNANFTEA